MAERRRAKSTIVVLAVTACLLLVMSYLITDPGASRISSNSPSKVQKAADQTGRQAGNMAVLNETASEQTDAGGIRIDKRNAPELSEIKLVPLDEQEASQLKRTNFEAFIRYQQRLAASNRIEPAADPETRKLAAEDRVQKRMANILLATKEKSK